MVLKHLNRANSPTPPDDVKAYCIERKNTVDPEHWYSYYEPRLDGGPQTK